MEEAKRKISGLTGTVPIQYRKTLRLCATERLRPSVRPNNVRQSWKMSEGYISVVFALWKKLNVSKK